MVGDINKEGGGREEEGGIALSFSSPPSVMSLCHVNVR